MMGSQLARIALATSRVVSADQQDAAPDQQGSYGELMDLIDRIVDEIEANQAPSP